MTTPDDVKPKNSGDDTEEHPTKEPGKESIRLSRDGYWVGQYIPTKDPENTIVVSVPSRDPVDGVENIEAVETMGLAVNPPQNDDGVVTVANTTVDTPTVERFAGFHVGLIPDLIDALEDVYEHHAPSEEEPKE